MTWNDKDDKDVTVTLQLWVGVKKRNDCAVATTNLGQDELSSSILIQPARGPPQKPTWEIDKGGKNVEVKNTEGAWFGDAWNKKPQRR